MAANPSEDVANSPDTDPTQEEEAAEEEAESDPDPESDAEAESDPEPEGDGEPEPEGDGEPEPEPEGAPTSEAPVAPPPSERWPGWPGDNVFRLIVPVLKVGSIIGRKGELIKKLCEETRARVRILEGPVGTSDRIVLVSGREEPEAAVSPAMDAVLRLFKRVNGILENEGDGKTTANESGICSVRLLVGSSQAINLIGKQGTSIKSIQESSGAIVRVLTGDELPFYATSDERIVEIQGESLKVLKGLEAVVKHLRKFLVDHSVIPSFEKNLNKQPTQDRVMDPWSEQKQSLIHTAQQSGIGNDYPLSRKGDSLFLDRETQLDSQFQRSGVSLYGQDPALSGLRSSGLGRAAGALVTQITQTMQIPLTYAEDIIGAGGGNIAYIRRTSGAVLTVQESRGMPDEIVVEIKGTSTQVQTAQDLIQEFIAAHKEPAPRSYGGLDTGMRSTYSQLSNTTYPSSSLPPSSYTGYGSSGLGGYGGYRF